MEYSIPTIQRVNKPSDIQPDDMNQEWFVKWAKWMYSMWKDGKCMCIETGYINGASETIGELRRYSRGRQNPEKYKRILDKVIKLDDNTEAGVMNISWRPPQVFLSLRERIIDRVMEMRFDPSVIAIDEPSIVKKDLAFFRDKIAASQAAQALISESGIIPSNITDNAMVMDPTELEQFRALGGYALAAEVALTEAVTATVDLCKLFPSVYRQVLDDLFDIGTCHMHVKHNKGDRTQTVEYIDPEYAIVPKSEYDDCRDITWGGVMKPQSIASIRAEGGFAEDDLLKIAKAYGPHMNNASYNVNFNNIYDSRSSFSAGKDTPYDPFSVMVLHGYMICNKTESFIAGVHASGSMVYDPVPNGTKIKNQNSGFRVETSSAQYVYKFRWIVGTDYVYACGMDDVTIRQGVPGDMSAILPIVTYRTNKPSVTEMCIGAIDDLAIAVYKKRHIISKMPPAPNMAIDISVLENITHLGNVRLMPQDLLDLYTVNGILLVSKTADYSGPFENQGSQASPITPMPDTTMNQLSAIQVDINNSMDQLRQITGSNEISDGTANPNGVLNKVAAQFDQSTNRSLSWLYTANESLQSGLYTQIAKRYQALSSTGGVNIKYLPIGMDSVRVVSITPDISLSDFQIIVKPGIDGAAKQMLIASIQTYKQNAQITPADEFAVTNMLTRNQYRLAQFYLAKAVDRKAKQDAMLAQQNAQAQAQAQGQAGAMVEQEKAKSVQMTNQSKAALLELEYKLKNEFADRDVERQIRANAGTHIIQSTVNQELETA